MVSGSWFVVSGSWLIAFGDAFVVMPPLIGEVA